ncbi:MAG: biotin/lipoyl-binding protein, partial [Alphaproteobacteria bacterium]|nr:biotin/lipoyl-binding protein [Alphaproteobacteria bacterium]
MPALSPTMEEGKLAKWHVKIGDKVKSGDVIAEIETDKATMEVEAVDEGVVADLLVAEGTEGVKVNAVIAQLRDENEKYVAGPKPGGATAAAPAAPKKDPKSAPAVVVAPAGTILGAGAGATTT